MLLIALSMHETKGVSHLLDSLLKSLYVWFVCRLFNKKQKKKKFHLLVRTMVMEMGKRSFAKYAQKYPSTSSVIIDNYQSFCSTFMTSTEMLPTPQNTRHVWLTSCTWDRV